MARGAVREVYARPGHPGQLLKVFRAEKLDRGGALRAFPRRYRPFGPHAGMMREFRCYLRVAIRARRLGRPIPIAEIGSVIRTDRGLAQVVAEVPDGEGGLAPTLRVFMGDGRLDAAMVDRLNAFVDDVYALAVNAPDLGSNNIVYDRRDRRFLLVDGVGEQTFIPIRAWIPWLNRRRVDARFAGIGRSDVLSWSPAARRFARRPSDQ